MIKRKYVFVCLAVGIIAGYIPNPFLGKADLTGLPTDEVILYSTSWCGYCKQARSLMRENDITFTDYDIETSKEGKAQYDQLRGNGVPLMLINGQIVRGYKPDRIKQLALAPMNQQEKPKQAVTTSTVNTE